MPLNRREALALAVSAQALAWARPAAAQGAPLKIGMVTTLSGPGGYLGQDIRDGFKLAMDMEGGKLGGTAVELVVEDDGLKPGQGKQIAEKFMKTDGIRLLTGVVFSNVLGAVAPEVLDGGGIYISPNAGPSTLAGRDCHPNYFVVSWQNDSLHEAPGAYANELGFKRAVLLAPNYQAGKDALTGFKRRFKGEVAAEIYTRLDQTDFASEMAQIRAANADLVYQFHPGGLGITFLRQYAQAGLQNALPMMVSESGMDQTLMKALGDAAIGVHVALHWNTDYDNPANKAFVPAYEKAYGRTPTPYASQGYDTALAIAAALRQTKGSVADTGAFRTAMLKADFASVRGPFKFGPNQHPVQDWWAARVEKGDNGQPVLRTKGRVLEAVGDFYAKDCKL